MVDSLVVGTGRAGTGVGLALAASGRRVAFLARRSGPGVAGIPALVLDDPGVPREPGLVVLAVPDSAVVEVASTLVARGVVGGETLLGHLSGVLPAAVLEGTAPRCGGVFSAHPLHSFPVPDPPVPMPSGTLVMIDAKEPAYGMVERLFSRAGAVTAHLDPALKARYHAAAVMGANLTAALVYQAARILHECGVPEAQMHAIRLVRSVIDNQEAVPGPRAMTGPFPRGDAATVAANLEALDAASREAYRSCGMLLVRMLRGEGLLSGPEADGLQEVLRRG